MHLTCRLLYRQNLKQWQTVVLPNGVIACWHPAITFPYKHSRPVDLAEMEMQKQEFLNREQNSSKKKLAYGHNGPDNLALREIFYTDMQEWRPRPREKRLYKSTVPVQQKSILSNPLETPVASVITDVPPMSLQDISSQFLFDGKKQASTTTPQPQKITESTHPTQQILDTEKQQQQDQKETTQPEQALRKEWSDQPLADSNAALSSDDQQSEDEKKDEEERMRRRERQWKSVKISIYGFIAIVFAGVAYVFCVYGPAPKDPVTGEVLKDSYSDLWFPWFWRVYDFFAFWKDFIAEPSSKKLLPDPVKPPWHQPKYTIVLELRNVLVNPQWEYSKGHYFVKRPALDYFMDIVGYPNFELVIYTSESLLTAAPVIQQIDTKGSHVNHALFRDATAYKRGSHLKDLNRLNRDLSKVIYIDWDPVAFQLNPENVLRVPKWEGDMTDTQLVDLAELLKTIYLSDVDDVRPILQFYSQFDNPMTEFRRRAQMVGDGEKTGQKLADEQQSSSTAVQDSPVKKYQGNLFGARRHAV